MITLNIEVILGKNEDTYILKISREKLFNVLKSYIEK